MRKFSRHSASSSFLNGLEKRKSHPSDPRERRVRIQSANNEEKKKKKTLAHITLVYYIVEEVEKVGLFGISKTGKKAAARIRAVVSIDCRSICHPPIEQQLAKTEERKGKLVPDFCHLSSRRTRKKLLPLLCTRSSSSAVW